MQSTDAGKGGVARCRIWYVAVATDPDVLHIMKLRRCISHGGFGVRADPCSPLRSESVAYTGSGIECAVYRDMKSKAGFLIAKRSISPANTGSEDSRMYHKLWLGAGKESAQVVRNVCHIAHHSVDRHLSFGRCALYLQRAY